MNKPSVLWVLLSRVGTPTARREHCCHWVDLLFRKNGIRRKVIVWSIPFEYKSICLERKIECSGQPSILQTSEQDRNCPQCREQRFWTMRVTMFPFMIYDNRQNSMRGAESFRTIFSRLRHESAIKKRFIIAHA